MQRSFKLSQEGNPDTNENVVWSEVLAMKAAARSAMGKDILPNLVDHYQEAVNNIVAADFAEGQKLRAIQEKFEAARPRLPLLSAELRQRLLELLNEIGV